MFENINIMRFLVGNWKMNGDIEFAKAYMQSLADCDIVRKLPPTIKLISCPPAIWLNELCKITKNTGILFGGQDCHFASNGAFTGDISAQMLSDAGCEYVIVGHSERRRSHGENDAAVAHKANAALSAELQPIICVGETKAQRDEGVHKAAIQKQIKNLLAEIIPHHSLIIAYEPVWAIGTGHTPTISEIAEMFDVITIECRSHGIYLINLLYGGSVTCDNASALFQIPTLSGLLVGNASMQLRQWTEIINAAI